MNTLPTTSIKHRALEPLRSLANYARRCLARINAHINSQPLASHHRLGSWQKSRWSKR